MADERICLLDSWETFVGQGVILLVVFVVGLEVVGLAVKEVVQL